MKGSYRKLCVFGVCLILLLSTGLMACTPNDSQEEKDGIEPGEKAETIEIIVATNTAEDSVNQLMCEKLKELLEERSNGRFVVRIYPNGQLGGDNEMTEALLNGNVDFINNMANCLIDYLPDVGVFDLPNLFPDLNTARRVLEGEVLNYYQELYDSIGLKLFGFADLGFRHVTANKTFEDIKDFAAFKIRVMTNQNHIALWNAIGAAPTPMDFGEVYISLQQGVIDGQESAYELIVSNKFYEPQSYLTETGFHFHVLHMPMNLAKYNSLTKEDQNLVDIVMKEVITYGHDMADQRMESRKQIIKDSGCEIVPLPDQLRKQIDASIESSGLEKAIRTQVGDTIVDLIQAEVAN